MSVETALSVVAGLIVGASATWLLNRKRLRELESAQRHWLELSGRLLPKRPGVPDFAEAESALVALQREEVRLHTVLDALGEGLALVDEERRVLFCNPAFQGIFRAREGQRLTPQSLPLAESGEFLTALQHVQESGKATAQELRVTTTPPRDIVMTMTPYSDPQCRKGIILTAFDVTQRKRAELVRSEFVANVSHELRTPLAAIRGYVETCLEPVEGGIEPPYRRFLPIIHQHALRLSALIEDLLILSRIESKGMQFNILPLQASPAVDGALGTLAPEAGKKNITLLNQLPQQLPDVLADASSLERILLNLVENAIKYSDERSTVYIKAHVLPGEITLAVEDTGIGIPKEDQARIFERFYRVDKARSRKAGGTGLGLSIVKHLVKAMGGEVWVDSEPGRGSTFSFTLPIAHRPAAVRTGSASTP